MHDSHQTSFITEKYGIWILQLPRHFLEVLPVKPFYINCSHHWKMRFERKKFKVIQKFIFKILCQRRMNIIKSIVFSFPFSYCSSVTSRRQYSSTPLHNKLVDIKMIKKLMENISIVDIGQFDHENKFFFLGYLNSTNFSIQDTVKFHLTAF